MEYANNGKVHYSYDDFKRRKGIRYDAETTDRYAYEYGANGQLALVRDNALNRQTYYEHDLANRPMRTYVYNPNGMTYWTKLGYDQCNNLHTFTEKLGDRAYTTTYTYDTENRPTLVQYNNAEVSYTYDKLGRMTSRAVQVGNNNYTTSYSYANGGHGANSTTDLISGITQSGFNFDYEYDAVGNIISETRGDQTTTYVYDNLNQLTRVNDPYQNKTFVYSYDLGGNIRQVRTYAYTTGTLGTVQETCAYTYGDTNWRDKMTAFGGKAITYDQIGNPTEYDGWTFVWQAGRQLKEMTKGSQYARFSYDHDGMRTRKQTESGRTDYYWSGKRLLELKVGDDVLHMYYDAAGKPAAVSYGNNRYRYVYNLQGDVVALVDAGQAAVVQYRYDAWGKLLATTGSMAATLGKLNPFRYRGYIYDEETGLYWLRSRYYNPEWKRFVNADSVAYLGADGGLLSYNLFAYCGNDPVRLCDPSGHTSIADNGTLVGDRFSLLGASGKLLALQYALALAPFALAVSPSLSTVTVDAVDVSVAQAVQPTSTPSPAIYYPAYALRDGKPHKVGTPMTASQVRKYLKNDRLSKMIIGLCPKKGQKLKAWGVLTAKREDAFALAKELSNLDSDIYYHEELDKRKHLPHFHYRDNSDVHIWHER